MGLVAATAAYLQFLRAFTRRHGIVLIADEVLNFRMGYRGAAAQLGLEPDITAFGTIIGGGLPIGAIAGRSEEHTSELQSLMRTSYALFCFQKNKPITS